MDRQHCRIIVADPREAIIRRNHPLVSKLHTALKQAVKRKWEVEVLSGELVPRTDDRGYSGILACLNVACWALFTNKNQRDR